ncbi:DUF58 domain-containing protein [candidate division KSB1 bacterium]|nr:DUF58 domain-containing protein [candidate division KSB1 bacterium]NIR71484.1 DUF58 domain-containing protein [candidate division KSB1 bacterium]NIS23405.1 DUF58 domain-containing protein [candidate division KSB1 bacterium]NIT70296.1 DUF58 domain-containing protein [candidate division KSB1 bacterium]NIU24019.1 DUF58 domain-containing protein [candidate division KSB1 bacterium]
MIPREILKKVKRIEIQTRGLVNDVFSGEYHSVFKGRGMEFAEVREYQIGDDIRSIDWNVSARMGHPYVKVFEEERELTVMLLVDVSSSGNFGTVQQMKGEIAIEICALLAFSAIKNNDKVGLIIFTDQIEKFVPPKKGKSHVLRVLRELLYHKPQGRGTDIAMALEYLSRVTTRRAVTFLVSDFISENYQKALQIANKRHDLIAITVTDPREVELPNVGFIELEDAETGEIVLFDTGDPAIRNAFVSQTSRIKAERDKLLRMMNVDTIDVRTDVSYVEPLIRFFRMRAKRFR